ncbi:hypothetical protein SeHB_A3196 [Salmonella enterica subsp. enterica serovar Heidelberg str. SL486]|nr:hypothetical protein SeHB_A3196 [Salmonella enterica subsp. enterica serovar Heidelberg str. SL486]
MRVKQICRPDKAFTPPSGIVFRKNAGWQPRLIRPTVLIVPVSRSK